MSRIKFALFVAAMVVMGGLWMSPAMAQQDGQGRRGQFGQGQGQGRGQFGGGNFDPEQMRAQMMERYKEQLGANDEEWGVIEPRLTKVMEVQRQGATGGRGFAFGGRGGRGQGGPGGPGGRRGGAFGGDDESPIAVKTTALMEVVQNEQASNDAIEKALDELREAREEHEKQLVTAQEDLRAVLTLRQEAMLVGMGMLE